MTTQYTGEPVKGRIVYLDRWAGQGLIVFETDADERIDIFAERTLYGNIVDAVKDDHSRFIFMPGEDGGWFEPLEEEESDAYIHQTTYPK